MDFNAYNHLSQAVLRIIASLVIALLGLIFGSFFGKLTKKMLREIELDKFIKKDTKMRMLSLEKTLPNIVKYVVYLVAFYFVLEVLGAVTVALYVVLGIILLSIFLTLIMSLRDYFPNLVAGIILYKKNRFKTGDNISMGNTTGEIVQFTKTDVKILSKKNELFIIPNALFLKQEFRIIRR